MQSEIKSNFEKSLSEGNFSSSQKDIKEKNFNKFIEQGFPNKRIEDWKFSDLNQIISTNFESLDFSKKDDQSSIDVDFFQEFKHNKIVFINGSVSKIDLSYENENKIASNISLVDLDRIAQIIDLASSRGAFRGNELAFVGNLYNKLFNFLSTVKAQQEANADSEGAEAPEETAGE